MPEPEQKHWRAVRHRSIALLSSYKSADSYAKKRRQTNPSYTSVEKTYLTAFVRLKNAL